MSTGLAGEAPVVTIVHGRPTPAEVAVITAVLLAAARARADAASSQAARPAPARPQWSARWRALPAFPRSGPGGWRASARPH